MSVLALERVSKRFDQVLAVDNLSFSVEPGTVFGFLGGNGAGKTTSLRMVLDIIRPTSGRIEVLGRPPGRVNAPEIGSDAAFSQPTPRMERSQTSSVRRSTR